ncbi:hypothetical protein Tcan_02211 [Toxocara canis]|uniref:E2F transcription factor CC-MB domain-containing protein n=1 Tax=Toxocara canis TaxID=6265 RepID=A0A0B2UKA7_TOXCA|nr:hypothetical protein Tcan_02211 [Toxocara canis]
MDCGFVSGVPGNCIWGTGSRYYRSDLDMEEVISIRWKWKGYVLYTDLRSLPGMQDQTLIAIKAPTESYSSVEVTDPVETGKFEILVRNENREQLQAFLCPDAEAVKASNLWDDQMVCTLCLLHSPPAITHYSVLKLVKHTLMAHILYVCVLSA